MHLFAIDGLELLKKSDELLIPKQCSYHLTLKTEKRNGKIKHQELVGFKKGDHQNVMIVKKPKRINGTVFLRKNNVLWNYFTTNHRLSKVSYQAFFMGTLLNYGDIMATELSIDYKVVSTEKKGKSYLLTLKPKKNKGGYGKIELYINQKTLYPEKRIYYALSGIVLKKCLFKKIEHDNHTKEIVMEFIEPLKKRQTIVHFDKIILKKNIPDTYFNEQNIKRFSSE